MKPEEVQELLAVSKNTLARIVASGELPVVRIRGQLRYLPSDVERYIRRCREQAVPVAEPPKKKRSKRTQAPNERPCEYRPGMKVV